jgi:hypothetical protein
MIAFLGSVECSKVDGLQIVGLWVALTLDALVVGL